MSPMVLENDVEVGESLPPATEHAVSVSLPTWRANVGYEEGEEWVISKMKTGYPRFFIHKVIQAFAAAIVEKHGKDEESAMLFPTNATASRCQDFFLRQAPDLDASQVRILDFVPAAERARSEELQIISPRVSAVLFPKERFSIAKAFWQHSGDGVSSRRAEYCSQLFKEGILVDASTLNQSARVCKGPRRYQKKTSIDLDTSGDFTNGNGEVQDPTQFVEERFGRNLDLSKTKNAKLAIRRRIAGSLTADVSLTEAMTLDHDAARRRPVAGFSEDDVYLYPTGMSSIFNAHRNLLRAKGSKRAIVYGFPYIDTLKITEKFGPGSQFYGFGSAEELDDLEQRLEGGERFVALFTEFPGNPLLRSPDLERIRKLADQYDFCVVVDETIGNFINVNVLQYADVVVSSLTKVFSGDSNVMGGGLVLNPKAKNYALLKRTWEEDYEDNHWAEDSIFLERNSRDFVSRIDRIGTNAEAICDVLSAHPRVKQVNYPKTSPTRHFYEKCRNPNGGYGGLLSATFFTKADAIAFFDNLDTVKGPSLGTNFTLSSPYVILAHYGELDWCAKWGVEADLIRFSVGLEETGKLVETFKRALDAIPSAQS
ncbi:cystathionine gamma-synthase [Alternaria alternata]|uniref:cystathionine gamma-synthase n=3 Tax=Alternaria sect. Alternaria TaxID=2499237 RepID=A0A177DXR7_ALTAL|nr:cystathionine gamma-synthase [Alternaria alternata]RII06437.1 cystathionine gamma-synthase [Alternaria sp. MG1]RYN26708.1 Cystathionine gamma-synthase [Alternaria tenuissima]RYN33075.1 Cystathionine gamma-synthase [Alternaria arborescens]KAH6859736.1 cystathionine gamma-synthase [Alternaria alternata]OAG24286.1 cystathionine gamma-synthase [Alternaria alternata]